MVASSYFFYSLLSMLILLPLSMSLTLSGKLEVPHAEIKCGACPCFNPCSVKQPPPPSPPQPTPVAPPPPRFVFVTGYPGMTNSPGSLYESDPHNTWRFYSGVGRNAAQLAIFAGCGVLLFIWCLVYNDDD